jgi:arylsulfatase A-like enzyme
MRLLYIDIDTMRPDHLGCYGYHRNTSPNIDSVASSGIVFNNYHSSDAPCLPSRTAWTTGQFGIHTGVVGHGGTSADIRIEGADRGFKSRLEFTTLPGLLSGLGIKTVSISPFAARHGSWSFYAGWDEMHNTGKGGMEGADDITPTALHWIREHGQEDNWLLHINYWDPHTPYRAPTDMGNPFQNEPLPGWITEEVLEGHKKLVGPHKAGNINMFSNNIDPFSKNLPPGTILTPPQLNNMDDVRQIFDGYDIGIRRADNHVGNILEALDRAGIFDDLVIIISSDHGENFGELGIYAEHGTADQITTRIPMIIRWPGKVKGHFDNGLHYNLDLLPTLADLLNGDSSSRWDGTSYAETLESGKELGNEFLVLSQCAHVCQRSVRFDKWIYIRTYHDGHHLFPKEMLFDLENDPNEQFNLVSRYPDICKQAVYYLSEWHDQMMNTMESPVDPMWVVMKESGPFHSKGPLEDYVRSLIGTERAWAVDEYRNRFKGNS